MQKTRNKYLYILGFVVLTIASLRLLELNKNEKFLNLFAHYYFDQNYYLKHYPEVKAQNIDPFDHYIKQIQTYLHLLKSNEKELKLIQQHTHILIFLLNKACQIIQFAVLPKTEMDFFGLAHIRDYLDLMGCVLGILPATQLTPIA